MKFENIRVMNLENAFRGMRNPKESYHLIDSSFGLADMANCDARYDTVDEWLNFLEIDRANVQERDSAFEKISNWLLKNGVLYNDGYIAEYAFIGPKDMRLAQQLIHGGSEHRKFLRQIFVSVDITAPLFYWKEFDTYKVGTTANSTSTMHKITSKPITLECFEIDDYAPEVFKKDTKIVNNFIYFLEGLRKEYLFLMEESKNPNISPLQKNEYTEEAQKLWKELIRWLPESWLQTRTVTLTYENVLSICNQRENHKLNEWTGKKYPVEHSFLQFANKLPYSSELLFLSKNFKGNFPSVDF